MSIKTTASVGLEHQTNNNKGNSIVPRVDIEY